MSGFTGESTKDVENGRWFSTCKHSWKPNFVVSHRLYLCFTSYLSYLPQTV